MMRRSGWLLAAGTIWCSAAFAQAPRPVTCGTPVDGNFVAGSTDFYNIDADPGDAILVRLLNTSGDRTLLPKIQVTDPINRQLAARPKPITLGASVAGEFDLAAGGPYQIRVLPATADAAGSYRLVFVFLNKPCSSTTLTCGAGARGQFSSSLETKTFQFQAQAGDVLSARFFRAGATPAAAAYLSGKLLMNGNQAVAGQVSASGAGRLDFAVGEGGTLTLVLFESGNRTGNFGVAITRLNRPCGSGTVACGAITQSSIGSEFNIDSFTLAANPGDVLSFRTTALGSGLVPYVEAYDASGKAATVTAVAQNSSRAVNNFLLTTSGAGPYTLLVRDNSSAASSTGAYYLSMIRLNRPCTSQGLTCSSLVDGSVSGFLGTAQYTLDAGAGDIFLFRLLRTDQGSSFRPRLYVYDSQGTQRQTLLVNDVGQVSFTAPAAGTYVVLIGDGFDDAQSGAFTLSSTRLNRPCGAGNLSCGGSSSGNLSRPLASAVYTYSAEAGDAFSIRMIDNSGGMQPSLEIYDPQGNAAGSALGGNQTGADVVSALAGTYTVIASDGGRRPAGGNFSVALLRTKNGCGAAPAPGEAVSGVVSAAAPFTAYSVPATVGDAISVRSASFTSGFTALMELYDPNGARLDSQTFSISRKAPSSGTYTVILGASSPRTAGAYSLAWQLLNSPLGAPPLACGGTTSSSLTRAGQFRFYSATAAAGDLIRVIFTRTSDSFSPQIELFDPSGARLAANADISVKAAAGGTYLVLVSPSTSNGETGSFAVAFQRPNNPCGATNLSCGQSTLRQVILPGQMDSITFNGTAGEQADIRTAVRSGSYAPVLELFDASGNRTGTSSSGVLQPALTATGAYTLLVRDRGGVNLGSYRVNLQNLTKACPVSDSEPPSITLVQPTGGDVIAGGSPFRIQWQSDDNTSLAKHDIALSSDGGQTFSLAVASGLSGNAQSYAWIVPPDIAPSRTAVLRITATDAAGNAQSAVSGPLSVIGAGFTANSTVSYTYDPMNRLTSAVLPDGRTVRYAWDAAGNLIQVTVTGQ